MTAFSTLAQEVRLMVPNAPVPLITHAVKKSAILFCKKSKAYRWTADVVPVVAGVPTVQLDIPSHTFIHQVMSIQSKDDVIRATSPQLMDNDDPGWRAKTGKFPTHYYQNGPDELRMIYTPQKTDVWSLQVNVALELKQTATELDDYLVDRYYDTILAGAYGFLYGIPEPSVNNPNEQARYNAVFGQGVEEAMIEANRENTPKDKVTAYGGL